MVSSDLDLAKNSTPLPARFPPVGFGQQSSILLIEWFNFSACGFNEKPCRRISLPTPAGRFGARPAVIDVGGAMSTDMVEITGGTEVPHRAPLPDFI